MNVMKLTKKIKELGHTCRSMEELTGIPHTTIWRHLSGTSPMPLSAALKYAEVLGISVESLSNLNENGCSGISSGP